MTINVEALFQIRKLLDPYLPIQWASTLSGALEACKEGQVLACASKPKHDQEEGLLVFSDKHTLDTWFAIQHILLCLPKPILHVDVARMSIKHMGDVIDLSKHYWGAAGYIPIYYPVMQDEVSAVPPPLDALEGLDDSDNSDNLADCDAGGGSAGSATSSAEGGYGDSGGSADSGGSSSYSGSDDNLADSDSSVGSDDSDI